MLIELHTKDSLSFICNFLCLKDKHFAYALTLTDDVCLFEGQIFSYQINSHRQFTLMTLNDKRALDFFNILSQSLI